MDGLVVGLVKGWMDDIKQIDERMNEVLDEEWTDGLDMQKTQDRPLK